MFTEKDLIQLQQLIIEKIVDLKQNLSEFPISSNKPVDEFFMKQFVEKNNEILDLKILFDKVLEFKPYHYSKNRTLFLTEQSSPKLKI